jgi:hypothetical protein
VRVPPQLRKDDQAIGQVVTFLVAGAIFLAAVGTVLVVSQSSATDVGDSRESAKTIEAAGLADILVGSAGIGWEAGPDGIGRLGLLASNGSGLDPASLDALRGAMEHATDNDKVDYEEALLSLGMDPSDSAGFHLRIYPVGLEELPVPSDLRVAYIADWTSLASVKVALPVGSAEAMAVKANVQLNATMLAATIYERQAIRALGMDFIDRVYITTGTPTILVDYAFPLPDLPMLPLLGIPLLDGDVYPDHKSYLDTVLAGRLDQYDVIVVGSGVDHKNLVKNEIKDGIKDWVMEGGTLIVLGSADKSTAWLNPLLNVGVSTVNGAPTAPDIAHPMLKEPNELAWTSYDSHGQGWDIQESGAVAAYEDFSHVVIQDGEDVLAVSKEGSFGEGRVILTSYHARDIAGAMSLQEATDFLENMVTYADRSALYLDYGGMVPADQPVALAVRQSWLWDSVYGQVPVRVEVLAWG